MDLVLNRELLLSTEGAWDDLKRHAHDLGDAFFEKLLDTVSSYYGLSREQTLHHFGGSAAEARHILMFMGYNFTSHKADDIGKKLSYHSSHIAQSWGSIVTRLKSNPEFQKRFIAILVDLNTGNPRFDARDLTEAKIQYLPDYIEAGKPFRSSPKKGLATIRAEVWEQKIARVLDPMLGVTEALQWVGLSPEALRNHQQGSAGERKPSAEEGMKIATAVQAVASRYHLTVGRLILPGDIYNETHFPVPHGMAVYLAAAAGHVPLAAIAASPLGAARSPEMIRANIHETIRDALKNHTFLGKLGRAWDAMHVSMSRSQCLPAAGGLPVTPGGLRVQPVYMRCDI